MAYRKMTLIPTNAGLVYECFYCKTRLETNQADTHECIPMHEGHDARVDDYTDNRLVECFTCELMFTAPKGN